MAKAAVTAASKVKRFAPRLRALASQSDVGTRRKAEGNAAVRSSAAAAVEAGKEWPALRRGARAVRTNPVSALSVSGASLTLRRISAKINDALPCAAG